MSRAFGALVRREVARGWRQTRLTLAGALIGVVVAAVGTPAAALISGICCAVLTLMVPFGPIGDLRTDKTQGYLEFDRVLPVSHRTIGLARMLGIAVRLLAVLPLCVPLLIAVMRQHHTSEGSSWIAGAGMIAGWVFLTCATWAFVAVNARWNLRRLWWLPMTIAFGPRVVIALLPQSAKDAIAIGAERVGISLGRFLASPAGVVILVVAVVGLPVVILATAVWLYAAALEHYEHDTTINEFARRPAPRRELGAIGRGPVLAVARYCVRLATEQMQRRVLLLVLFVAALLFGSAEIKSYAQIYVRTLAVMLPGAIVIQLASARTLGYLETFRLLPHPPMVVALGHLLALSVLALPGAAVWVLARAMGGRHPTLSNVSTVVAVMVTWVWLTCVGTVWLTRRRSLMLAAPVLAVAVIMAIYTGGSVPAALAVLRTGLGHSGAPLALAAAFGAALIGLPVFARAIDEYEPSQATQQRASHWFTRRQR